MNVIFIEVKIAYIPLTTDPIRTRRINLLSADSLLGFTLSDVSHRPTNTSVCNKTEQFLNRIRNNTHYFKPVKLQ
jgi:hypothetical protein